MLTIRSMGKEYLNGQMAENILEPGWMESRRALECTFCRIKKLSMDNGKMAKELDGS